MLVGFVTSNDYVKNADVLRDRIERRKELCGGEEDSGNREMRKFLPNDAEGEKEEKAEDREYR